MNRLLTLILFLNFTSLLAQEPMRVTRSAAVDRNIPIQNIYIDENNVKWIGNSEGVFQVHSVDYATQIEIADDELSLLSYKGGNHNLKYSRSELLQILKDATDGLFEGERDFAGAFYDSMKKELWVGTHGIGVFRIKLEPAIELLDHFDMSNSKLRTDYITVMFSDKPGSYWIGTEEGVLHNPGGKWQLFEKYVKIEAVEKLDADVWVFGDGWLWKVDASDKWTEIDLDKDMVEGKINDIALDHKGNMWIASEVITRFHMDSGYFDKFGAGEYFTSNHPTSLAVDQEGAIWVGTEDKGLYLIEKESAITVNCLVDKELGCDGKNDAALKVIVSGGEEPFSYEWAAGLTGENPTGLGPGTYEVTVTDKRGKKRNAKATIEDPGLTLSVTQDRVESAANAKDGAATVSVEGGQADYKFLWDNGETTSTAEKLNEGQHGVTVTDQKGCIAIATVMISQELESLSLAFNQTSENKCFGDKNAAIAIEIKGGLGPYQTKWSNPEITGEQPTGLAAGLYQATVTDAQGNTTVGEFNVLEPETLATSITIEAPVSTDNADGKASAKVTGGTGPYTFSWDNGETTETALGLAAGVRNLIVTDASGCTTTATVAIDENILPLSVSIDQTAEIKCFGDNAASIEVKAFGGKGPFTYQWSVPELTGNQGSNLVSGEYILTLTDAEGTTTTGSVKINDPERLTAEIIVESPATTDNADGKASVKVAGSAAPFSFTWDNGETTETALKLAPGTRTLTVTDASGCTASASVEITENILPLSVSIDQTADIKCYGDNAASIEVKAFGGKGPFTYQWSKPELTGNQASNLAAGEYSLTLTDAEGTTTIGNIQINDPEKLAAEIVVEAPATTDNADGKASVKIIGGTAPLSYKWDNGETTETAIKLAPGTRSLIITDASGCTTSASIEIDENILPLSVLIDQTAEIKCFGGNTASLEVKVNGGKRPFTYQWSEASIKENTASGLIAGEYIITITDAEGTTTVGNIKVNEPLALTAEIIVESPASTDNSDGVALAKVAGGTAPFSFAWDNGETSETASKLGPGTQNLVITDASGCTTSVSVGITENILPLSVSIDQTADIKCFGGNTASIEVKVNGGKRPFTYEWSDTNIKENAASGLIAGEYILTLTDAVGTTTVGNITVIEPEVLTASIVVESPASTDNSDGVGLAKVAGGTTPFSFTWDNGETSETASKLGPGTRNLIITDASGCTTSASVEITENILPLSVSIDQTNDIKCFGGNTASLEVKVIGGKGPFTYEWNNPEINGGQATNLIAGNYTLTITDAVGTTTLGNISIKEPVELSASITVEAPASTDNADGKAIAKVIGGTAPYSFAWDNAETTATASKLAPGTRNLVVNDASGCSTSSSVEITENILPLSFSIDQISEIKCFGDNGATVEVKLNGGKGPYTYQWSEGGISGGIANNLKAGTYLLTVTDAIGTPKTSEIVITEPTELLASISRNGPATDESSNDGVIELSVKGGQGAYSYKWDSGENGPRASKLSIGEHKVEISDANGCSVSLSFTIKKRILPELTVANLREGQTVKMEELFFEADSFRITNVSLPVIVELYDFMKQNNSVVIEVGGHTNNIPEHAFCDALSKARAKSIADYIVQMGIDPKRVYYKGYGKRNPIATNSTPEGRAKNQRVEIKIISI